MSQATVEEGGTQSLSQSASDDSDTNSVVLESPRKGSTAERVTEENEVAPLHIEADQTSKPASDENGVSELAPHSADAAEVVSDTKPILQVPSEGELSPDRDAQFEISPPPLPVSDKEPDSGESSDKDTDTEECSEVKPSEINESTSFVADGNNTDQAEKVEPESAEDITLISPDPSTACQPSDPEASTQAASEPAESAPQVPDSKDSIGLEPDPVNNQPVEVDQVSELGAGAKPTPEATDSPQPTSGTKHSGHVVLDIEKASNYSPGVNGSAQVADCPQLSPEVDDSTPLLTPRNGDDSTLPLTSPSASNATTPRNRTARGLRSRLSQSVKIPIREDCFGTKRMATSLEDITSLRLWKGIIAEFVGVLLLVLVGCGSCLSLNDNGSSSVVQIALCFGLSVATIVWNIGHISGGHINPAVTLALLATRRISLAKAIFFVLFQLVGAVVGAGILMGLTPKDYQGTLGSTLVSEKLDPGKGLGVEIFITFVLVFTVFASIDSKRRDLNGSTPLTIGLSVTMCHLFAIQYTGSSMNTARSFGPALVTGKWDNHWVYWVGPITGGVAAGLLYEYLFAVNASLTKVRACVLSSDYDDEKFRAKKLKVRILEEDPEATAETLALTRPDDKTAIEDPYSNPSETA